MPSFLLVAFIGISVMEIGVLVALLVFYKKVKKSEEVLSALHKNQHQFMAMLAENSTLEQEFAHSFSTHIATLQTLDKETQKRIYQLEQLLHQADGMLESPKLLRETILRGYQQGNSLEELAKRTGASIQEIEFILSHTHDTYGGSQ